MVTTRNEHNQHYASGNIDEAVSAAVTALNSGDNMPLAIEMLAGLDQFHIGGLQATRELARHAAITAADRVLDVGGGLGGPARWLAQEIGCQVTVLDLTEAYIRIGTQLTAQVNLTDRVQFRQGDALDLPFEDGSFDVVWTQHSSMNVPDKARMYAQIHRVLRPGGRLALFEVTKGSGEAIHLPTMWAHYESMNFLVTSDSLRDTVTTTGFQVRSWEDLTNWATTWFQKRQQALQTPTPDRNANPLGLHLLLGADTNLMLRKTVLNLQEGRIRIAEGVFERV